MPAPSSKLPAQKLLVQEIEKLHGEILDYARTSLDKAIKIGGHLSAIKSGIKHGDWETWIKINVTFSLRTVQNYMRIFQNKEVVKSETILDLRGALELLSGPAAPVNQTSLPPVPVKNATAALLKSQPIVTSTTQQSQAPQKPSVNQNSKPPAAPISKPPQLHPKPPIPIPVPASDKPKDGTGFVIPPGLMMLWNRRQEIQDWLTMISNIRSNLDRAQTANDPLYSEVNFSDVQSHLDSAYAALKPGKPFAVCPTCKGKEMLVEGCTDCKCRGLVSQFYWDNCVPIETRQMREENNSKTI